MQARNIPDASVTLPLMDGEPALLVSTSTQDTIYQVNNPLTDWACCDCAWAQKGNICKHQLKVIFMLTAATEMQLMQRLGTFKGQANGGMQALQDSLYEASVLPLAETDCQGLDQPELIDSHQIPLPPAQHEEVQKKQPAPLHQTDNASIFSMMQTILAECADDQELRAIMAAGLAATLGSIRNARALQQGSLPHP